MSAYIGQLVWCSISRPICSRTKQLIFAFQFDRFDGRFSLRSLYDFPISRFVCALNSVPQTPVHIAVGLVIFAIRIRRTFCSSFVAGLQAQLKFSPFLLEFHRIPLELASIGAGDLAGGAYSSWEKVKLGRIRWLRMFHMLRCCWWTYRWLSVLRTANLQEIPSTTNHHINGDKLLWSADERRFFPDLSSASRYGRLSCPIFPTGSTLFRIACKYNNTKIAIYIKRIPLASHFSSLHAKWAYFRFCDFLSLAGF